MGRHYEMSLNILKKKSHSPIREYNSLEKQRKLSDGEMFYILALVHICMNWPE